MIFWPVLSNVFRTRQHEADSYSQAQANDDSSDIKRMPVDLCGHCGKTCSDKGLNEAIQCDLCAAWVYASCEGVSSDDYKLLTNLTSSTENGFIIAI